MGYVNVLQTEGFNISVEKGLWLYLLLTFPLILSTLAILAIREFLEGRKPGGLCARILYCPDPR